MTLWLTRPAEDSAALAAALTLPSIIAPVMEIVPIAVTLPNKKPDALVLTSRHAAYAIPNAWHALPVYCVGEATAEAARAKGCNYVQIGKSSALDLLPLIHAQQKAGSRLLHLSGEEVKIDLVPLLALHHIQLERSIVYTTKPAALPDAFWPILRTGSITGAVFYSPQSARFAMQLLGAEIAHLSQATAYCLSLDVAHAAAAMLFQRLLTCPVPTHTAMLELLSQTAITAA